MSSVEIEIQATADRVYAEFCDGWSYVGWVVGATHIRDVDAEWPAVGSKIHHKVGSWPVELADYTEVLRSEPDRRLTLRARGWPAGEATVDLTLRETSPGHTLVRMDEVPSAGPGRWLDSPVLRAMIKLRNTETLRRLRDRVENRQLSSTDSALGQL
jgi:hypothetical protein